MTKRQVTDYAIENDLWVAKRSELDYLLDEHAQSLAKEVIEELDFAQSHNKNYSQYDNGLRDAMVIIKQKFNLQ